jgi:hypothetical protein
MGSSASAEGDEGGPKKKPGEEEPKPKFEKGSENDCSNGPTKNRGYPIIGRDFPFCVLFYGGIFAFFTIAATSRGTGNADERKLIVGQDFMGNSCGARGNQNLFGGGDLEAFRYVYYTLNLTAVQGRIADALYPSSTSNVAGTDPTAFASMDPATLMTQYSGDPNSMISELKKYFHPVCVKSCSDQATGRSGYWEGYLDWATWQKTAWKQVFVTTTAIVPTVVFSDPPVNTGAQYPAFNEADCPYPSVFCVPITSLVPTVNVAPQEVKIGTNGYGWCVPTVPAQSRKLTTTQMLPADYTNQATGAFEAFFEDIRLTWLPAECY